MRILHINSYFSTSGLFQQMYQRQLALGNQLDVYVPIAHEFPADRLATAGDYTLVVRCYPQWSRWIFPLKHQLILKDLKRRYADESFDIIHAHSLFSNGWLAYQMHLASGAPFMVAVRNADLRTFFQRMPWMRKLGLKIMQAASKIVFISNNTLEEVFSKYVPAKDAKLLRKKVMVIPNGIDDFWHTNQYHKTEATIHAPLRLVATGKLMAQKRFLPLAQWLATYATEFGPAELHLIGPVWEKEVLAELEQMDNVIYHGPKNLQEMLEIYREMDIFAMLSRPETFGLVYVEAMSQGLPLLYTAGEGFDNFFPNGHVGYRVAIDQFASFEEALNLIRQNYATISRQASEAIHRFDWDQIVEIYQASYQEICEEAIQ